MATYRKATDIVARERILVEVTHFECPYCGKVWPRGRGRNRRIER